MSAEGIPLLWRQLVMHRLVCGDPRGTSTLYDFDGREWRARPVPVHIHTNGELLYLHAYSAGIRPAPMTGFLDILERESKPG